MPVATNLVEIDSGSYDFEELINNANTNSNPHSKGY